MLNRHNNNHGNMILHRTHAEQQAIYERCLRFDSELDAKLAAAVAKQADIDPIPAYRLPDGVWFNILEILYRHRFPYCRETRFTLRDSPIPFTHVSKRFREVALACPTIWSCVHVNPCQPLSYVNMLRRQLDRSGDEPMCITFICKAKWPLPALRLSGFPGNDFRRHFEACWRQLLPHMRRWLCLTFAAEHQFVIKTLFVEQNLGSRMYMPQLEHLDLSMERQVETVDLHTLKFNKVMDAPKLQTLNLRMTIPVNATFDKITRLSLTKQLINLREFESMLEKMAGTVEYLGLHDTILLGSGPISISLPLLRHLVLRDITPLVLCIQLFSSGAPNISELEIQATWTKTQERHFAPEVRDTILFPAVRKLRLISFGNPGITPLLEPTFLEFFPVLDHLMIHAALPMQHFLETYLKALFQSLSCTTFTQRGKTRPLPPLSNLCVSCPKDMDLMNQIIALKESVHRPFQEVVLLLDPRGETTLPAKEDIPSPPVVRYEVDEWMVQQEDLGKEFDWRGTSSDGYSPIYPPPLPFWLTNEVSQGISRDL